MTINHNCQKRGCYVLTLPDWGMLSGCFGSTKINEGISDLDGVVYQNGKCLFLEKKFPKGFLSEPQVRMINTLITQGHSFIAIWCERSDGTDISFMRVWGITGYDPTIRSSATLSDFRNAVKKWWKASYQRGMV